MEKHNEASVHFKVGRSSCLTGNVNLSDTKCRKAMWKLTEKSHFCALSVTYLRLVCILKLEGLLEGYVKWKNTMTGNVNVEIDREITFLCPLRYIFGAF